jgi:putative membrane protein
MSSGLATGATDVGGWLPGLPLLALAVGYGVGIGRLAARGDSWPRRRTVAAVGGLTCLGAATLPPIATRDEHFSMHVMQHLLLSLLGPMLLALCAPVTLALRAGTPRTRRGLLGVLRSRPVRLVTYPLVVVVLDLGGPYLLYLTPLYASAESRPLLHSVVHLHMLVAGCLFAWCVVGVDPIPHRSSLRTRLLALVAAAGGHDILAKLMYGHALPAVGGPPEQLRTGAQLMYYGGDVVEILMALVLLSGWYARSGRALAHRDRRAEHAAS